MSESYNRFQRHMQHAEHCIQGYDTLGHSYSLRHVWITSVSAFDLYMTELVSEAGLRLIDKTPRILTPNLRRVEVPLERVLEIDLISPLERILFYRDHIFSAVQFTSFYKPEGVSLALSYIWLCPAKEKWSRILSRLSVKEAYLNRKEQDIREELTLIGDRRDLIAHSVDIPPGRQDPNPVDRQDAIQVAQFITDLAEAIDSETESQMLSDVLF